MDTDKETKRFINVKFTMLRTPAMRESGQYQAELLNRIQQRRFFNPKSIGAPNSTALLREDRER